MKRFFGWLLAGTGLGGAGWSAYYLLSGSSHAQLAPLPINAMTGGLIAVALLTVGLIWVRE